MFTFNRSIAFLSLLVKLCHAAIGSDGVCRASCGNNDDICVFHVKLNLFASELGHFQFEECGDVDSPTLGIEYGKTYYFIQVRISFILYGAATLLLVAGIGKLE